MTDDRDTSRLKIRFHGRIIDHLGIQMYQSPVAAIAELVANAWDADSSEVRITLPDTLDEDAVLRIEDDGHGMTFEECEERYLNVGYNRRIEDDSSETPGGRPLLGRKGIGKFAGFGIAERIKVSTVSGETGEKIVFELNLHDLRSESYVAEGGEISVEEYQPPNEDRRKEQGTSIILKRLTLARRPSSDQFRRSMSRRFLLLQWAEDFRVKVNGQPIPEDEDLARVEFMFPRDFTDSERDERQGLTLDGDWGVESLLSGQRVRWRVFFFKDTIDEEELQGIAVFSKIKLAQRPFFFNLSGGLSGQHGQAYMAGQVLADYVDQLTDDLIATERQRINWEHTEAIPLQEWGQSLVKRLLGIWRDRRGEARRRRIENRLADFVPRLEQLVAHERRTVEKALKKLGGIETLSDSQFDDLGGAILTAWEQGRLRGLIDDVANSRDLTTARLLEILVEADVLVALNVAEVIRTKLEAIRGLRRLVHAGELENAVRDYIAEKPYLLHPRWETFKREVSLGHILDEAAGEARLSSGGETIDRKRIDLALRSNEQLLVVEFMRPGATADYDHLSRVRRYIHIVRDKVEALTALEINYVTGLFVADHLADRPDVSREVKDLRKTDIFASDWQTLLEDSSRNWREFLAIVGERAPGDQRLAKLVDRRP